MEEINLFDTYIVNPAYKFRNDVKRIILTNNNSLIYDKFSDIGNFSDGFSTKMHPLIAYVFSFFNGEKNLKDNINEMQEILNLSEEEIKSTIRLFIYNKKTVLYRSTEDIYATLPINFLIKKQNFPIRNLLNGINLDTILDDMDLKTNRHFIPNQITLMLNNQCVTDCVYCYANTAHKVKKSLSFTKVKELISEAYSIGCSDVNVGGGDLFLYKKWPELIKVLHEHEYEPFLSTKYPIDEKIISKLKELKVKRVQISLDTINPNEIVTMLNVDNSYLDRIKRSLELLEKYQLNFRIKSVITKYNDSINSVKSLVEYLLSFKNLEDLTIAPGESSLYKPFIYSSTKINLEIIEKYINEVRLNHPKVSMQGYMRRSDELSLEEKIKRHTERNKCSGNMNMFYALPDGKVSICEQLYWHPFFILGDLTKQSIMEVWNSEKAISLWNISQDEIKDESPCKTCKTFEECRRGKGTCWRLAVQAYGHDNYDFPDPECPHASPDTNPIFIQ